MRYLGCEVTRVAGPVLDVGLPAHMHQGIQQPQTRVKSPESVELFLVVTVDEVAYREKVKPFGLTKVQHPLAFILLSDTLNCKQSEVLVDLKQSFDTLL